MIPTQSHLTNLGDIERLVIDLTDYLIRIKKIFFRIHRVKNVNLLVLHYDAYVFIRWISRHLKSQQADLLMTNRLQRMSERFEIGVMLKKMGLK